MQMKTLKGFLAGLLLSLSIGAFAIIGGGVFVHNHSGGATGGSSLVPLSITMGGTISSTKACSTGFTRVGPNYCALSSAPQSNGSNTVCSAWNLALLPAPAADAKAFYMQATMQVDTANAAGVQRTISATVFSDNACTNAMGTVQVSGREEVAAVTTPLAVSSDHLIVRNADPTSNFWILNTITNCPSGCSVNWVLLGYFD